MQFQIDLLQHALSPVLNIFIWLYEYTHNFALTIIFLAILMEICLYWPVNYVAASGTRIIRTSEALGLPYRLNGFSTVPMVLANILAWYLLLTFYLTLAIFGSWSLPMLNSLLFPFVAKLSVLPSYELSLFGETVSLVQHGFLLWLVPLILPFSYVMAVVNSERARRQGKDPVLWWMTLLHFLLYMLMALVLSWVLAAGAGLYFTTSMTLYSANRLFLLRKGLLT